MPPLPRSKYTIPDGPLAVAFSGGGAYGSLTTGNLQFVVEVLERKDFRIIYGTSTGALQAALLGAFVVTGDPAHFFALINIYQKVLTSDVIRTRSPLGEAVAGQEGALFAAILKGDSSVYDPGPLLNLIQSYLSDDLVDQIFRAGHRERDPIEIGFAITSLNTGESKLVTNRNAANPDVFRRALLASACQPVFMGPVDVFDDGHHYVDGGLTDSTPIQRIFESSIFGDVTAVLNFLTAVPGDPGPVDTTKVNLKKIPDQLLRSIAILGSQITVEDMCGSMLSSTLLRVREFLTGPQWVALVQTFPENVQEYINKFLADDQPIPVFTIFPRKAPTEIAHGLDFSQPGMKKMVARGFREAKQWFNIPTPVA